MSRPTDPLRDKIAAYLSEVEWDKLDALDGAAEDIIAIVRRHVTSGAAVEAAARTIASNRGWDWEGGTQPTTRQQLRDDARAALAAFVAGKTGG